MRFCRCETMIWIYVVKHWDSPSFEMTTLAINTELGWKLLKERRQGRVGGWIVLIVWLKDHSIFLSQKCHLLRSCRFAMFKRIVIGNKTWDYFTWGFWRQLSIRMISSFFPLIFLLNILLSNGWLSMDLSWWWWHLNDQSVHLSATLWTLNFYPLVMTILEYLESGAFQMKY